MIDPPKTLLYPKWRRFKKLQIILFYGGTYSNHGGKPYHFRDVSVVFAQFREASMATRVWHNVKMLPKMRKPWVLFLLIDQGSVCTADRKLQIGGCNQYLSDHVLSRAKGNSFSIPKILDTSFIDIACFYELLDTERFRKCVVGYTWPFRFLVCNDNPKVHEERSCESRRARGIGARGHSVEIIRYACKACGWIEHNHTAHDKGVLLLSGRLVRKFSSSSLAESNPHGFSKRLSCVLHHAQAGPASLRGTYRQT